jgi:3-isopropylmalate dehydratase small subunit
MKTKRRALPRFDGWCFAIVNNRLAEIYFKNDHKKKKTTIWGHCYVEENEFKTKEEKQHIKIDSEKHRLTYRNKKYTRKKT